MTHSTVVVDPCHRTSTVRDTLGNLWWIQTHMEDVSPGELQRRIGDPTFAAAMEYATSAEFFPVRPGA
jgi:hypothetical protein